MAHQLEIVNGEARMFFVGQDVPWHGLGKQILDAPDTRTAIVAAGLDWTVRDEMLFTAAGRPVGAKAIVRDDNNAILCHHIGPDYQSLQNQDAFAFFDPFVTNGLATFETAGSLNDGRRIWVLAKIKADPMTIVKGDDVMQYILLSNSHDGTMAVRAGFTPIRVVCANTLAMAHTRQSRMVSIRHTSGMNVALDTLRSTMDLAAKQFEATAEQYRFLAQKGVTQESLKQFVKLVFVPEDKQEESRAGERALAAIIPLFEQGLGNDMPGVAGTFWGLYNAATEYLQHDRGDDAGKRLNSAWFGQGKNLNDKALAVATKLAKVA